MYYFTYLLLPHQLLFPLPFCVNDTKREEEKKRKKTLFISFWQKSEILLTAIKC